MRDLQVGALATAVLAVVEQTAEQRRSGLRTLRWTSAGHLPPLLLEADGASRLLTSDPDLPQATRRRGCPARPGWLRADAPVQPVQTGTARGCRCTSRSPVGSKAGAAASLRRAVPRCGTWSEVAPRTLQLRGVVLGAQLRSPGVEDLADPLERHLVRPRRAHACPWACQLSRSSDRSSPESSSRTAR